jgi:monoamine oxidase
MAHRADLAKPEPRFDVAIVGAGLTGLVAAAELEAAGRSVRVLEAQSTVGGRIKDVNHPGGDQIELGANWFSPNQPLLAELIDRFGLAVMETYDEGTHTLQWDGRRKTFRGKLPPLGPVKLLDIGLGLWKFDRLARSISGSAVWGDPNLRRADSQTFENWIATNLVTRAGRDFFRLISEMVFGAEASLLSLLYVLYYANRSDSLESLITVKAGHQGYRFRDGPSVLCKAIADTLGAGTLLLDHPVTTVEREDGLLSVGTGKGRLRFRTLLVAISPVAARSLRFTPDLTPERKRLINSMPMGRVIKVQLTYRRPFWRDRGLSGQVMSNDYPLTYLIDNSSADEGCGVLAGFVCSSRADQFMREPNKEDLIARSAQKLLGIDLQEPLSVHIEDWAANPWIGGSYGAYCPPGVMTVLGGVRDADEHPIYWSGAEYGRSHPCQMEGAIESGQRAAKRIHEALSES